MLFIISALSVVKGKRHLICFSDNQKNADVKRKCFCEKTFHRNIYILLIDLQRLFFIKLLNMKCSALNFDQSFSKQLDFCLEEFDKTFRSNKN